ncbi:MAG: beta-lactamase family protein [Gammaproteobacteria bacterium]|nr:beta-lactamase family protein [Gammaproteobacteria bacterium]MCH9743803.1 beta-lactamase family protein [Gammaproteobacteria bacterium]
MRLFIVPAVIVSPSLCVAQVSIDGTQFKQRLNAIMREYHIPGGAVAIISQRKLLYAHGVGWANRKKHIVATSKTLFRIASISKTVTAISILKLMQMHKLKLDEKVYSILNNLKPLRGLKTNPTVKTITLRNLLNMTSGWNGWGSNVFDPMFGIWPKRYREIIGHRAPMQSVTDARLMLSRPLHNQPGKHFHYANINYCMLGLVVDKVLHKPYNYLGYEHFVQRHVLRPMGIYDMRIGSANFARRLRREAIYYPSREFKNYNRRFLADLPYSHDDILHKNFSDGGWLASAQDLAKIASELEYGNVLTTSSLRAMFAKPATLAERHCWFCSKAPWHYGMGWFVQNNHEYTTHGSFTGSNSLLIIRPDHTIFAFVFNSKPEPMGQLWEMRQKLYKLVNNA